MDWVSPDFNRLTVFDSRYPHGVRVVEGTHDPREGRLVLHGWFLVAAPFFAGALSEEAAAGPLNDCLEPLYERLAELPLVRRAVALRLCRCPFCSWRSALFLCVRVCCWACLPFPVPPWWYAF